MRILVTGATGSLGLPLCKILKDRGFSIIAQGRNVLRLKILEDLGVETRSFVLDNCGSHLEFKKLVSGCEAIVHSAALTRPWGPRENFVSTNIEVTEKLLKAAQDENVKKFIHISTTAVYYDGTSRSNLTETSSLPTNQKIQYAATKLESENIAKRFAKGGVPVLVLRPRAILSEYDQTLLPRLLRILKKGFFPLIDGGQARIDLTPVESIAYAIIQGLDGLPKFSGEIYNLTNDEPVRIADLLRWVSQSMGLNPYMVPVSSGVAKFLGLTVERFYSLVPNIEPPISKYSLDLISNEQTFDISKIKRELLYKPVIGTQEAIQKLGKVWQ